MFVMHRLVEIVENQLSKHCRRRFNFGGKIQHTRNQKNCKLEGGGAQLVYLYKQIVPAAASRQPQTAGDRRLLAGQPLDHLLHNRSGD
jgi:hypothetical protein